MSRIRRKKINAPHSLYLRLTPRDIERFLAKCGYDHDTGCWPWLGYCDSNGYGQFRVGSKVYWAHRVGHALFRGRIPVGREIDHYLKKCIGPRCVCPWHTKKRSPLVNATNGALGIYEECPI